MSRIGKKPITVPGGVKVSLDPKARMISVEGPKGKLSYAYRPEVAVTWDESEMTIVCSIPQQQMNISQVRAHWGTARSRIQNMLIGVTEGYTKRLEIVGVGYCLPVDMTPPAGVEFAVTHNVITVSVKIHKQALNFVSI